jgi:hypothetical protein
MAGDSGPTCQPTNGRDGRGTLLDLDKALDKHMLEPGQYTSHLDKELSRTYNSYSIFDIIAKMSCYHKNYSNITNHLKIVPIDPELLYGLLSLKFLVVDFKFSLSSTQTCQSNT